MNSPELYKKYLEYILVSMVGRVHTAGMVYFGMDGLAAMIGSDKAGYTKNELLELIAASIIVEYLSEHRDFETYLSEAEKRYDEMFWDHLMKEDIDNLMDKAKAIFYGAKKASRSRSGDEAADTPRIIDAHVHLGEDKRAKYYSAADLKRDLATIGAAGAVVFAFPEAIYRKVDTGFNRIISNQYILEAARNSEGFYPFYFVWNDFIIPENLGEYAGIKWHRHFDEPRYDYSSDACRAFLSEVKRLGLPVLYEEEFSITEAFVRDNPELNIIIPHIGELSGGADKMSAFYDAPNVYFDTSTAPLEHIAAALDKVGPGRIIFGSDVSGTKLPYHNFPHIELDKVKKLGLKGAELEAVLSGNILGLIRAGELSLKGSAAH